MKTQLSTSPTQMLNAFCDFAKRNSKIMSLGQIFVNHFGTDDTIERDTILVNAESPLKAKFIIFKALVQIRKNQGQLTKFWKTVSP